MKQQYEWFKQKKKKTKKKKLQKEEEIFFLFSIFCECFFLIFFYVF